MMVDKVQITLQVHPDAANRLKQEAWKRNVKPSRLIKELIRQYYSIDCDTGEHPVYIKVRK